MVGLPDSVLLIFHRTRTGSLDFGKFTEIYGNPRAPRAGAMHLLAESIKATVQLYSCTTAVDLVLNLDLKVLSNTTKFSTAVRT